MRAARIAGSGYRIAAVAFTTSDAGGECGTGTQRKIADADRILILDSDSKGETGYTPGVNPPGSDLTIATAVSFCAERHDGTPISIRCCRFCASIQARNLQFRSRNEQAGARERGNNCILIRF